MKFITNTGRKPRSVFGRTWLLKNLLTLTIVSLSFLSFAQTPKAVNPPAVEDTTARELGEVKVTSRYYKKYQIGGVSSSLRTLTPLLDLSQNIQEVNKDVLADQQANTINESVTRNVSGAVRNNISDFYSPKIVLRGAEISPLRNGVDLNPIYRGPIPEDAALIDRVEFIKGPAGFMNSVGDPAGSYNVVTKQPTGRAARSLSVMAGSFDLYRAALDLDGKLTQDNRLQYRLNVVGDRSNSFVKYNFNNKLLIAPVVKYQVSTKTAVTAEYIYQRVRFLQFSPTVFSPRGINSLPKDFTIVDPNLDPYKGNEGNAFLTLSHKFSDRWSLTARGTSLNSLIDGRYFFVSSFSKATPTILQRTVTTEEFRNTIQSAQAFVNGSFGTGGVRNRFLGGLDANWKQFVAYQGFSDPSRDKTIYPLDIDNPVYGIDIVPQPRSGSLRDRATAIQGVRYVAVYLQDELGFLNDKLRLTLAGRLTYATTSADNRKTVTGTDNTVFTPRIGLSYSIAPTFTIFGLWDNTFTPQAGLSATNQAFEPLRGQNLEAGLKKDWRGGTWNTTLSVYRIVRDNILVTDPANIQFKTQLGQSTATGVDFDLKGQLAPGLNAVVNYAYSDSRISRDTDAKLVGLPAPYTAKHIQNTWLNYALPGNTLRGFGLAAGYQYQGGRTGRYPQDGTVLADYFRLDGGINWSNEAVSVRLLVNNLLNANLYGSAWARPVGLYTWVPLEPRSLRVSATYRF